MKVAIFDESHMKSTHVNCQHRSTMGWVVKGSTTSLRNISESGRHEVDHFRPTASFQCRVTSFLQSRSISLEELEERLQQRLHLP